MRINGANLTGNTARPAGPRRTSTGSFTLSETDEPRQQTPAVSIRTIGGIETLIALQGIEEPGERRRRAVKSGRNALDVLEQLKLAVLAGDVEPSALQRLKAAAAALKESSGDPALDAVLGEITLRVEVEIAKLTPQQG